MGPLLLLDKNNFNQTGQVHLEKLKPIFIRFILALVPLLIFMSYVAYIRNGNV